MNDKLEAVNEIAKIEDIFKEFKVIADHLYELFMKGSSFESLIDNSRKSDSVVDVAPVILNYIYNNFNNVDQKLQEKIMHLVTSNIHVSIPSKVCLAAREELKRPYIPGMDFNGRIAHQTASSEQLAFGVGFGVLDRPYGGNSHLHYWLNEAPRPLPAYVFDQNSATNRNYNYGGRFIASKLIVVDAYNANKDNFTQESLYTHPLNFQVIRSSLFPIVAPGARNMQHLATREITLAEKVGISLVFFGSTLNYTRENDPWKQSAVPEFGIRVSK